MNNQEKTVHEYLSGYFGVDLNESIDLLTESDIRDAVQDLNTLVFALNEQTASFGNVISAAQKAGEYRDLLAKRIASKGRKLDPKTAAAVFKREFKFEAELPGRVRAETDRLGAENKADYDKKFTDVTPFERAKNAMKLMDKPDGSFGTHGEKNRKNLKPKFKKEVEQRSRLERAGMDPNREDYDSLDTQLSAHAGIVAQERRADKKRRGVTPSTSDYRLPGGGTDYAAMAQDMRESRTLREQSGGASSSVVPGSEKKFGARDMTSRQGTLSPEEVKNQQDALAQAVADNPTSRAAMDAAAQHQQDTRPERLARAIARQAHSDRVQGEITNRRRAKSGRGPLKPHQMMGTEASKAASGQTTLQDRYKAAVEARTAGFGKSTTTPATTPLEAPSEDDYMKSEFPGGKYDISKPKGAPKGATTYEKPDGSGFSTIPPKRIRPGSVNLGY